MLLSVYKCYLRGGGGRSLNKEERKPIYWFTKGNLQSAFPLAEAI